MNHKEEMTRHLLAAEAKHADVEKFENWADKQVEDWYAVDLAQAKSPGNRESIKYQKMSSLLEREPLYGQRARVRDFHLRMAEVYGIAVLVEEVTCG